MNISTEFNLVPELSCRVVEFQAINIETSQQFIRSFRYDDIHKFCELLSAEYPYLIVISYFV